LDGELLEGEPLEGELFAGEPLDGDPEDDPEPGDPEPDDGGSAGCAGVTTGVCGWEAAIEDDGFPPHPASPASRKAMSPSNTEFLSIQENRRSDFEYDNNCMLLCSKI